MDRSKKQLGLAIAALAGFASVTSNDLGKSLPDKPSVEQAAVQPGLDLSALLKEIRSMDPWVSTYFKQDYIQEDPGFVTLNMNIPSVFD